LAPPCIQDCSFLQWKNHMNDGSSVLMASLVRLNVRSCWMDIIEYLQPVPSHRLSAAQQSSIVSAGNSWIAFWLPQKLWFAREDHRASQTMYEKGKKIFSQDTYNVTMRLSVSTRDLAKFWNLLSSSLILSEWPSPCRSLRLCTGGNDPMDSAVVGMGSQLGQRTAKCTWQDRIQRPHWHYRNTKVKTCKLRCTTSQASEACPK
jgi:hypothetical protein